MDGHVLGTLCAVTMALLTNRLDLCIQGLFGAGKSKSMAVLILALIEIDTTNSLKILFIYKENSGTRSFADLLLWLDPPSGVFGRVGDQERNKSSYSHTKFDIHPRERRQMQVPASFGHRRCCSPRSHHAMVHAGRLHARVVPHGHRRRPAIFFCGRRQLAFAWSPHFEAYLRTSGESNRHR